jgi:hypothetical protein
MSDHQQGIRSSVNISAATWFPNPTAALSGTISTTLGGVTSSLIIGTGTKFLTELCPGDWILVPGSNEIQQIFSIDDNTSLHLFKAFQGTVTTPTASTYQRVKNEALKELEVIFITTAGTVRGSSQALGTDATYPAGLNMPPLKYSGRLDPQLVTPGGGGTAFVSFVL